MKCSLQLASAAAAYDPGCCFTIMTRRRLLRSAITRWGAIGVATMILPFVPLSRVSADDSHRVALGKLQLEAPASWKSRPPKSSVIAYEFSVPKSEGDAADGRFTISTAGGGVAANLDRWIAQFTQPDGSPTRDHAKIEKKTVAGAEVHLIDVSGTYKDRPSPMAPGVDRPKYRLLGAVVVSESVSYFLKFYGPERTVAEHRTAFLAMIDALR